MLNYFYQFNDNQKLLQQFYLLSMSITIQYCTNCKTHQWNTRHNQARYQDLFHQFQQKLKSLGYKVKAQEKPKLGSFEISLGDYLLFSKLDSGQFPDVESVVKHVEEFNKLSDKEKWTAYQQIKKKRERGQFEENRHMHKLSTAEHRHASFSPLKHRQRLKLYAQSQKMSNILSKTRRQANYSVNKTSSVYNPSETARSKFFPQKEQKLRQTNPEWGTGLKLSSKVESKPEFNHRDPFQHDDKIISENKSEKSDKHVEQNLGASANTAGYNQNQFEREDSAQPKENVQEREKELRDMELNAQ